MQSPNDSTLGQSVAYPQNYDPTLLFPIPRAQGRQDILLTDAPLPFDGLDRWYAYELSWLNELGKPVVATATITVPATSPNLIESKSLKLYLNSLNNMRYTAADFVLRLIKQDLSKAAGASVEVQFGLPEVAPINDTGLAQWSTPDVAQINLDAQNIAIQQYDSPDGSLLKFDPDKIVREVLFSDLLKSNCPVTAQPDWASVRIAYHGPQLDPQSALRYLVSFRNHAGFHEQCVEQIFCDVQKGGANTLSVDARYTRRGGLDINPWRATIGSKLPIPRRDERQ